MKVCTSSFGWDFSARVIASYGLAAAVVAAHSSSSQLAQVPMASTTVSVASTVPLGQPSLSGVEHSSVPPLLAHGNTVFEDLQGPIDLIGKQHETANRLTASRLAYLESVRNDSAVPSGTVFQRNSTVK